MPIYDCGDPDCASCEAAFRKGGASHGSSGACDLPPLPEAHELEWPEYHYQGMGCGLEDRCITDRYQAMEYGWNECIDRTAETLPDRYYTAEQMTEYATAAIAAWNKRAPSPAAARVEGFDPGPLLEAAKKALPGRDWLREGSTICALDDDVDSRGRPLRSNYFWASVQTSPRRASPEEVDAVSAFIHAAQPKNILAWATRDAAASERIAELEGALRKVRKWVQIEHDALFESVTIGGDPATMDDCDAPHVAESMDVLATIDAALGDRRDA